MMYRVNVLDKSRKPIAGAKLTAREGYNGVPVATFDVPASGYVILDDTQDYNVFQDGITLVASAPGFYDTSFPALSLQENTNFLMEKKPNYVVPGLLAAGALLFLTSKKRRVKGFFDNMPPMAKNALVIGGVGIAVYYLIFKGKDDNDDLPNAAADELAVLAQHGVYPTISEAEADGFSATIVSAADDCGTDENAIWGVFQQLQNKADLLLLIKQYGIREYKGCFDGDYFSHHRRNLAETITSELSSGWIADINDLLSERGINFSF